MGTVSVAVVDDHPVMVQGIMSIFANTQYGITAQGRCAQEAVAIASTSQCEILIMDLNVSGDVLMALSQIRANNPGVKTLVYTSLPGVDNAVRALEAGASGYVSKSSSAEELVLATNSILAGETYISRNFATGVITALRNGAVRRIALHALRLSVREDQVIALLLAGKTNKDIAFQLNVSERTVKHYMTVLMQKLNVRNRVEVILAAQKFNGPASETRGAERAGFSVN